MDFSLSNVIKSAVLNVSKLLNKESWVSYSLITHQVTCYCYSNNYFFGCTHSFGPEMTAILF